MALGRGPGGRARRRRRDRARQPCPRAAGWTASASRFADLIEPSQHGALARRLSAADDSWRSGTFAFRTDAGRPATDRRLWIAGDADELLVIGEPLIDEQERLVEKVLELNDELVSTHRELVRQRRQIAAAARARARRSRRRSSARCCRSASPRSRASVWPPTSSPPPAMSAATGTTPSSSTAASSRWRSATSPGKGIPAAALMGELRGGLRAGVFAGGEPHETLRVLDRMTVHAGHMATVVLVLLDPATGALRHASAGHLPPALVVPGGEVRFLTAGASTPLLAYDPTAGFGSDRLAPGRAPHPLHRRPRRAPLGADRREPPPVRRGRRRSGRAGRARRTPPGGAPAAAGRSPRRHRDPRGATRPLITPRLAILAASQLAAVVKLVYTQASGACGLYARGGSSPLSRTPGARCYPGRRGPCRYRLGD